MNSATSKTVETIFGCDKRQLSTGLVKLFLPTRVFNVFSVFRNIFMVYFSHVSVLILCFSVDRLTKKDECLSKATI